MKIHKIINIGLILAVIGFSVASQAASSQSVNYQAYLKDVAGLPVNAVKSIIFRIHDADVAGTVVWSDTQNVTVVDGLFSVELGSTGNPLPVSALSNPLWLSIDVDAEGESSPRMAFSSVNNAFRAEDADKLGGVDASALQLRVSGECPSGSAIRTIDANGLVSCEVDVNTGYSGNDFVISDSSCAAGQVATGFDVSGVPVCSSDVLTNSSDIGINSADIASHSVDFTNPHSVSAILLDALGIVDFSIHQAASTVHHARYTGTEAFNALKAADGTGSTLDADLLDVLSSSRFLRSNASDTYTSGTLTFNSGTTLQLGGLTKVGSGSASDNDTLYFDDGSTEYLQWAESPDRFELSDDLLVSGALNVGATDGTAYGYNMMRNTTSINSLSGDMSSRGDLFVGYDLEVGGEIYADRVLYMNRDSSAGKDADQKIYFYDGNNRSGKHIGWNDFEGRFDISSNLRVGASLVVNNNLYADSDIHVTGNAAIGYRPVLLSPTELTDTVSCFLDAGDEQCFHASIYFSCGAGERIISGGCSCTNIESQGRECYINRNIASSTSQWNCAAIAPNAGVYVEGRILCAKIGYGN